METQATTWQAALGDTTLDYAFSLEHLPLRSAQGARVGTLSAFSYIASVPDQQQAERPVLFLTNGGPGAASSFLHLSGIGPFRAVIPKVGTDAVLPPYDLVPSGSSLLAVADLVFIDAPLTGLGTLADGADPSEFYSMEGDARAFAAAITEWVQAHGRWSSPKYFLGESYGTHRAAFLATASQEMDCAPLNGLALLGQAVNIQEISERPGNVSGALANLPFKAAVAWYHGRGSKDCASGAEATQAALDLAWGDLARVMFQGNRIASAELRSMAERLEAMIGISAAELAASRLWISKGDFLKRLLRDEGLIVGSNDARYTAPALQQGFGELPFDPSGTQLAPRYLAALNQLLDRAGFTRDRGYAVHDMGAARAWQWDERGAQQFMRMGNPSPFHTYPYPARLSRWMKQSANVRLFVGTGLYDSLTTVGAADHLLRQWDLPADRVSHHWYDGGHMMYANPAASAQLNADLRTFVTGA